MGATRAVVGFVLALLVLDVAALRFGHDSRDGAREFLVPADPPTTTRRRNEPTAKLPTVPAQPFRQRLEACPTYTAWSCPRLDLAALGK